MIFLILLSLFLYDISSIFLRDRSSNLLLPSQSTLQYNKLLQCDQLSYKNITYDDLALKKCKDDEDYSIHGWWPEYSQGTWPQWCNKTKFKNFDSSSIEPIIEKLNKYWYACKEWNMTNMALWTHELNKHGSCINDETILHYFTHTLEAYENALDNDWYGCCDSDKTKIQCLIPFSKEINTTKWVGYCH